MSDRRIVNEHATRRGVFVTVSIIADTTSNPGDITDAINVAADKARDRFTRPEIPAGQLTLPEA